MFFDYIIIKYFKKKRDNLKTKFNRVVPMSELLSDRWEKGQYIGMGLNSSVYDSSIIFGDIIVGKNTWIGPNTILDASGGELEIGNNCDISAGVQIYTHDSVKRCISGKKIKLEMGDVNIGDNCYIGPMSIISKGVKIGSRCVVGAHSFVNKSYEPNSIIAGIPATKIGTVVLDNENNITLQYEKDRI